MRITIILSLILLLVFEGCKNYKTIEIIKNDPYVVLSIDPPKRLRINLKRLSDGSVISDYYVAKRCSKWNQVKIGDTLFLITTLSAEIINDSTVSDIIVLELNRSEIYSAFCQ